jgi:hypothetical protein
VSVIALRGLLRWHRTLTRREDAAVGEPTPGDHGYPARAVAVKKRREAFRVVGQNAAWLGEALLTQDLVAELAANLTAYDLLETACAAAGVSAAPLRGVPPREPPARLVRRHLSHGPWGREAGARSRPPGNERRQPPCRERLSARRRPASMRFASDARPVRREIPLSTQVPKRVRLGQK